jgi:putative sigma-54 modulation protein
MQITISGHHVEINDTLRDYVNTKFTRLQRHADHMTTVHVILRVEKFINFAEATVHIAGHDIFAEADDKDMYAAIDVLPLLDHCSLFWSILNSR